MGRIVRRSVIEPMDDRGERGQCYRVYTEDAVLIEDTSKLAALWLPGGGRSRCGAGKILADARNLTDRQEVRCTKCTHG